ncbi:hypothetical protein [Glutamicibacter sp. V16R2B1]|uniref:hypothetical protein n=1 Tax=Glutamicibacter sp. V16R2B1 TaxID=2036207 RepID=UPI0010FEBA13|nr:hypothetical protein [Glutamicibacter sp. V16R2B1]MCK9901345.1 hypothetical protein [Frankia sp. Cpl3]TLK47803.1 hypothetical protein FDN03_15585 [Glutamicibacter sp. V16R2B1]
MTLIDDREVDYDNPDRSDGDVETVYAQEFDAVETGLVAVLRLAQDPDYDGAEDIAGTALAHAYELDDTCRATRIWDAAVEILAVLDVMDVFERARLLAEADAVADEKFYAVAGYPAGGAA